MFHEHFFFFFEILRREYKRKTKKGKEIFTIRYRSKYVINEYYIFFLQILDEGKEISLEKETKEMITISLPIDN